MNQKGYVSLHIAPDHERVVSCSLIVPGFDRTSHYRPDSPAPSGTWFALRDNDHKKRDGRDAVALAVTGALVLRRSIAEEALAPLVGTGEVRFSKVALLSNPANSIISKPKVLSYDWVLVETDKRHPIDRDTVSPELLFPSAGIDKGLVYDESRPFASLVARLVEVPVWPEESAPKAQLLRPLEVPGELLALAKAPFLKELIAQLGEGVLDFELADARVDLMDDLYGTPAFPGTAESAKSAAKAAFRRIGGGESEKDRALALAHPYWAFALARCSEGPADDTRKSACAHPLTALLYARDVDKSPRDDTRNAACAHSGAAAAYMRYVDRGEHPQTVSATADHRSARDVVLQARHIGEIFRKAEASAGPSAEAAPGKPPKAAKTKAKKEPQRAAEDEPWTSVEGNVDSAPMASFSIELPIPVGAPLPEELPKGFGILLPGSPTAKAAKKRVEKALVLTMSEHLAVRRSAVLPIVDLLEKAGLGLRALPVISAKGEIVDEDFAVVVPRSELPLDRAASDVEVTSPENLHGSWVMRVDSVGFGPGRAPKVSAFRIADAPSVMAMRASVADALKNLLGRGLIVHKSFSGFLCSTRVPTDATDEPHTPSADVAAKAADAFFLALSGDTSPKVRALACKSPFYALQLARAVDQGPRDDTRRAALAHPYIAAEYASCIDRAPREDTREAAAKISFSAEHYARYVDRALTPPLVNALVADGWSEEDLATLKLERRP